MKEIDQNSKKFQLLTTAFKLFTEKGIKDTSIQEIVDEANVGKGTFYLYFKDKYEIRDILIAKKSHKLFNDALNSLRKESNVKGLTDEVIYIINYVIDELTKKPTLLKFISKNLSLGIYTKTIQKIYEDSEQEENGIYNLFIKAIESNEKNIDNPNVKLFMIIELVSSTCFNSILYDEPLPINEYKPFLYDTIKKILD